jgi:hypothetical protein
MQELVQLTCVFSRNFSRSSKLNKFLHREVNLLIQHIIVQDQDGQNNNISKVVLKFIFIQKDFFILSWFKIP